jgi:hypothetical protein
MLSADWFVYCSGYNFRAAYFKHTALRQFASALKRKKKARNDGLLYIKVPKLIGL